MNTDTGDIYRTPEQVKKALERGEEIAMVSEKVAEYVEAGREVVNRAERRRQAREANREAKRLLKASRR